MDWLSPLRELFGFAVPFLDRLPIVRVLLGLILVFFLPGFAWTFVFFRQLKVIERIALSFGLSIAVVTLSLLFLHRLVGIRITGFNSLMAIIIVTIIPVAVYYLNRLISRHH
jgi:uncharacterized membrane protein